MGDSSKDHMELDDHQEAPSLQIVRDNFSPRPSLQMQREDIEVYKPQVSQDFPAAVTPQAPVCEFPSVPERRASQFEIPPGLAERRPSTQFEMHIPQGLSERRPSTQFEHLAILSERRPSRTPQYDIPPQLSDRRPSSMLHVDKDALYERPLPPPVLTDANERPSLFQQQLYLQSSSQTPRTFVPIKRDSGFMSQAATINEAEPYSPGSVVSSSGEGVVGIDRGKYAMLARAYQDKQQSQVKAWEKHKNTRNLNKYESESARITAWEACQVAKCEALMKKSEEELEKKRAKIREGFKNEIASIHRRAEEWKALAETRRVEELLRTEEGAARFRATGMHPKKPLLHIQSLRDMCCGYNLPYER